MIVDCHTHWGMVWEERDRDDPTAWLAVLDRHGVDKAFLFGHYNLIRCDRCREDNDRLALLTSRAPERLVPFGTVWPQTGREAVAETERCLGSLGMRGLKFHPWLQGFSTADPVFGEVCALAGEWGAPILLHDGTPCYSLPEQIGGLARRFPATRFVLGHSGLLWNWRSALEAQRRFVADASHELRTPLATIQGNAGMLATGPEVGAEVRRAAAADIAGESERMARLTDRLLTLARADSGLELTLAPVDLRPLVAEVVRQAGTLHPNLELTLEASELVVAGDADALRQLLWILLDNASRHANKTIAVTVQPNAGWARVMVADDGPGVPPEDRERVFERFYKGDSSRAGGGGAGLGLAIARWIADQHRGRIIAADGPRGGAGFFVDLPVLSHS